MILFLTQNQIFLFYDEAARPVSPKQRVEGYFSMGGLL